MDQRDQTSNILRRASALWCQNRVTYGLVDETIEAKPGSVLVEALASAVSRGTERLVLHGNVPPTEYDRMRCPHQAGEFPFPVKYGYALVGRVAEGPGALKGRTVFALHPHQALAALSPDDVVPVPDGIPPARATLAANLETALNVVWDSGAGPCDNVLVVGAGVVGLLVARLISKMPGANVTVCDPDEGKQDTAVALGARFAHPADVPVGVDVAINASGTAAGLATAIEAAGLEARVVEASWHGTDQATVPLGGAFHSQRLSIVSSQVGRLPPARAPRWTHRRRLEAAIGLLDDPALDGLITHEVPFQDAPVRLPALLDEPGPLAIVLRYRDV